MEKRNVTLGINCKLYQGPEGLTLAQLAVPDNINTLARDVAFDMSMTEVDTTTRGADWETAEGILKAGNITGEMLQVSGDERWEVFFGAYMNRLKLSMFIANDHGEGLFGDFSVLGLNMNQALRDAATASFTIKPAITARVPRWVKTAAGLAPEITSAPFASGTAGTSFTFQLTASPAAASWSAERLPAGLSLNSNTGEIAGTPTAAGTSTPMFTAVNAGGTTSAFMQFVFAE